MNYLLIVAIATVALFSCGADAQCYNCTYIIMGGMKIGQEGCMDPGFVSDGIATVPCADKCKTAKVVMAASAGSPEMTTYARGCHNEAVEGPCADLDNFNADTVTMSQTCCTGALCNSAALVQFGVALLLLAPLCAWLL